MINLPDYLEVKEIAGQINSFKYLKLINLKSVNLGLELFFFSSLLNPSPSLDE